MPITTGFISKEIVFACVGFMGVGFAAWDNVTDRISSVEATILAEQSREDEQNKSIDRVEDKIDKIYELLLKEKNKDEG